MGAAPRIASVVALTVTLIAHRFVLPLGSVALTFTVRTPGPRSVPGGSDCETVAVPARSLPATEPERCGRATVAASAGTFSTSVAGHTLNTGAIVSLTVTLTKRLALL